MRVNKYQAEVSLKLPTCTGPLLKVFIRIIYIHLSFNYAQINEKRSSVDSKNNLRI